MGIDEVVRVHASLARLFKKAMSRVVRCGLIDGLPGIVTMEGDGLQTTALEIVEDKITAIYVVRNPDKLRHLSGGMVN